MSEETDIVEMFGSSASGGVPTWQGGKSISDKEGDFEPLAGGDVYQGLGLTSMPSPRTEDGFAEAVALRGVAGRDTCYVGARDTRSATIVGNIKPGDTVLHSTGPQQAAQVQLKEEKRIAALVSKDGNDKTMSLMLDGTANKFQVALAGMVLEMDANSKAFTITNGQASIMMSGSTIALDGNVILGGKVGDPVNKVCISPLAAPGVPAPIGALTYPIGAASRVSVAVG